MEVQERRRQLLNMIRSRDESLPITMNNLAECFHVSVRTIHSDLDALCEDAEKDGFCIMRKSGLGVWTQPIEREKLPKNTSSYIMSRKDRRDVIILYLLSGKTYASEILAEHLAISRNTFLEDLKEVKETLAKYGLSYLSRRGQGIWAEGGEQETRDMIIHIFAKNEHNFKFYKNTSSDEDLFLHREFRRFSANIPIREMSAAFLALMKRWGVLENDDAVSRMICALVVQLVRLQQGHVIQETAKVSFLLDEGQEIERLADEIALLMKRYDEKVDCQAERAYIIKELLHSKIFVFPQKKESFAQKDINLQSLALARRFIQYAQVWMGGIYLDDDDLVYNLAMHLQPAVERAHFGIVLTNPLLGKIQDQYQSLYSIAKRAAAKIAESDHIHFSEDEIGYITIHLGAAVERKRMRETKRLSVLLVCGNGVGTASLMAMTLKRRLPYINIVKTVSFYKLQKKDLQDIDLVISTTAIDLPGMAVLHVSPIMTPEEIDVISSQIEYFHKKKFITEKADHIELENGLPNLLIPAAVQLDAHAVTWEEAIRMSGQLLQKQGAVTEAYVERMVECIRKFGAYIIICPGVAIPHAGFDDGVRRVAVSFLRLKEAVPFRFQGNESYVDLFFAFSTTDETSHRRLLEDLWEIFQRPKVLQRLRQIKEKEEVVKFLCDFIRKR